MIVAVPDTKAAVASGIPRRMSDAPPPPNPGAIPLAPPFHPPVEAEFAAPTNIKRTSPGVTGTTPSTRPPLPAANPAVAPPLPPFASTRSESTPAGTTYDCTPPVYANDVLELNWVWAETAAEYALTQAVVHDCALSV